MDGDVSGRGPRPAPRTGADDKLCLMLKQMAGVLSLPFIDVVDAFNKKAAEHGSLSGPLDCHEHIWRCKYRCVPCPVKVCQICGVEQEQQQSQPE